MFKYIHPKPVLILGYCKQFGELKNAVFEHFGMFSMLNNLCPMCPCPKTVVLEVSGPSRLPLIKHVFPRGFDQNCSKTVFLDPSELFDMRHQNMSAE